MHSEFHLPQKPMFLKFQSLIKDIEDEKLLFEYYHEIHLFLAIHSCLFIDLFISLDLGEIPFSLFSVNLVFSLKSVSKCKKTSIDHCQT